VFTDAHAKQRRAGRFVNSSRVRTALAAALFSVAGIAPAMAQYRGDRIPGNAGLEVGSQPPPGIYVGYLGWFYPTDTVTDANGDVVGSGERSLRVSLNAVLVSWVTPLTVAGANVGGTVVLPWIRDRIEGNVLDIDSGLGYTDMIVTPVALGWHLGRTDLLASYSLYLPTGKYERGGRDNSGLGMLGQEVSFGTTIFGPTRHWHGAVNVAYEWHTEKKDLDLRVGQVATLEGGVGYSVYTKVNNPLPLISTFGVAGYGQFKVTEDSGEDLPALVRGGKDRVVALGPEVKVFIPQARLTVIGRVMPEFGAQLRTEGVSVSVSLAYVARSFSRP
jgi:hypothetical protein